MRKIFSFAFFVLLSVTISAEGLVTRTNQSASWVRLPSRNASTSIDAVFYNPAGLTKMEDGFHLSFSNQSIFSSGEIINDYSGPGGTYGLNYNSYKWKSNEPFSPQIYGVYKRNNISFSFGYNTISGKGKRTFLKGLPSLEMNSSDLVPFLPAAASVTDYNSEIYYKDQSMFKGFQGGLSFKINKYVSVAAGLRYVRANSEISGHIKNIQVTNDLGISARADNLIEGISSRATDGYVGSSGNNGTSSLVTAGLGSLSLWQVPALYISPARRNELENSLGYFGYSANTVISDADAIFRSEAQKYNPSLFLLGDQYMDVKRTGSGLTPYFSIDITPNKKMNIAIKYEMATKIELKNSTFSDITIGKTPEGISISRYPDGAVTRSDLPVTISIGVSYILPSGIRLMLGTDYFFDKSADYGHYEFRDLNTSTPLITHLSNKEIIDQNRLNFQAGIEYNITDDLLMSCGWEIADRGVNKNFQSDLEYSLASQTIGLGGEYILSKMIRINVGAAYVNYMGDTESFDHNYIGSTTYIPFNETYRKKTLIIGAGVDFSF